MHEVEYVQNVGVLLILSSKAPGVESEWRSGTAFLWFAAMLVVDDCYKLPSLLK